MVEHQMQLTIDQRTVQRQLDARKGLITRQLFEPLLDTPTPQVLPSSSSLLLSSLELSDTKKSVSLKYEPASEPLHISVQPRVTSTREDCMLDKWCGGGGGWPGDTFGPPGLRVQGLELRI